MKRLSSLLLLSILSTNSWAVKLSDYRPFAFETLFTNPVCQTYGYGSALVTNAGNSVTSKPDDVYCKPSDESASVSRRNSPQYRLVEWITDSSTKELYVAYLSFSSKNVVGAFCSALQKGVKLTMVLDGGEGPEVHANKDAEGLKKCATSEGQFSLTYRGSTGGLGYAHNKILVVNPHATDVTRIVFSSGNLTSGTSINHENWNFVTTSPKSFFAQAHRCVVEGMVVAGDKKANFANFLNKCRSEIQAQPESDIRVFFSPVDGKEALEAVSVATHHSVMVEGMSHRFSGALAELFAHHVAAGKKIRFIFDDDIYWSALLKKDIGRNTRFEAFKIYNELISKGMETKFLQTNQNVFQLQHNKFLIFDFGNGGAVFNGAGNLTTAAFTQNFENFYYITIPSVVEDYRKQYRLYFDKMATSGNDMPRDYVLP
ncbi:MAG TPA: phospholipase D-like domain-containing protein [Bacteriovoracaceae bacterium]|nr:phospholipase D-like domain-containing protein [Bacteriovoracaceae bacterium]